MRFIAIDAPDYFQWHRETISIGVYGPMAVAEVADALDEELDTIAWDMLSEAQIAEAEDFISNLRLAYPPDEIYIEDPGYESPVEDMEYAMQAYFEFEQD